MEIDIATICGIEGIQMIIDRMILAEQVLILAEIEATVTN